MLYNTCAGQDYPWACFATAQLGRKSHFECCLLLVSTAELVQPCLKHLESESAVQATLQGSIILLPNSDFPLAVSYNTSKLQQIRSCVTARLKILKARSRHGASSAQVQAVVHMYLAEQMPTCRREGSLGKETETVSTAHLQLVHEVGLTM